MTLVVRDEEDILATNLDYHLAQGVDLIVVIDHGSGDATPGILRDYERTGRLRWFRDEAPAHDQSRRVNRLLRIAAEEHGAEWVIHGDADEFWMPAAGSLRDVFAAVPERYGYIQVKRDNFLPVSENGEPFYQRMVVRYRCSLNPRGARLEPKVAQRPGASATVGHGNHHLEAPVLDLAPDIGAVQVLHFPLRTFEQFERKVLKVGTGYELLADRPHDVGVDQLNLLALERNGELREYYESEALDAERIERGIEAGELVIDRRLKAFLSGSETLHGESPAVQELLRGAWTYAGACADAKEALTAAESRTEALQVHFDEITSERDATIARLATELEQARTQTEQLRAMLDIVRDSRLMRYTARARRIYYRVRRT